MSIFYTLSTAWYDFKRYLKYTSRFKIYFTVFLVVMACAALGRNLYVLRYNDEITEEMARAVQVCEKTRGFVQVNLHNFRMYKVQLWDAPGAPAPKSFKFVRYPEIKFRDGVFQQIKQMRDEQTYCVVTDPRSRSTQFHYRIKTGAWVDDIPYHP